jgi:uncharacterized protein (DUF58 family)
MQSLLRIPTQFFRRQFFSWIDKRHSQTKRHLLHRKNLYIFPSITGFAYLLLVIIIWLLGTNYQNNLILALAYMQISVFVLTILNTYNNMAGLRVEFIGAEEGFVGEKIAFRFLFASSNRRGAHYITAQWLDGDAVILDFEPGREHIENVYINASRRGWLRPRRLLLKSTFPMGLLRCWTWLNVDAETLVYPEPVECELPIGVAAPEQDGGQHPRLGSGDEFAGFRTYKPGDSPRRIAWKHYARDLGLWSKDYGETVTSQTWLQWNDFFRGDVELGLSHLCFWVEKFTEQQRTFGLKLPGVELPPDSGMEHRQTTLRALATFEVKS